MARKRTTDVKPLQELVVFQCVGELGCCVESGGVNLRETTSSEDLGGSSKYSAENIED